MHGPLAWWRSLPGPTTFRLYTRFTLHVAVVAAVVATAATDGDAVTTAGLVVAGVATVVALEARTELTDWPTPAFRRWATVSAVLVLVGLWVASAVVAHTADDEAVLESARAIGVAAVMFGTLSFVAFLPLRWWWVAGLSVVTGLVIGAPTGSALELTLLTLALGVLVVSTTLLTLWGLRIVNDVERAKDLAAELQLAEERLRFSRDLHDVVGRSFSAIAVKSELAVALSRAGAAERASAEMDEVKAIAVESMDEMRTLVRGYRDIDLDSEVAGARSLLSAAGCALVVEGEPAAVPTRVHELAAWVVREGTTNIVKHSSAGSATLALGPAGMSLRNDGVTGPMNEPSGLRGLSERLAAGGADLTTTTTGDEFVLQIRWETA